jgi:hypothetical protein
MRFGRSYKPALIFAACTRCGNATGDPPKKRRKKRRPASVATTKAGPKSKSQSSQAKNTKSTAKAQGSEHHSFAIYDGQIALGFVEQIDKDFTATDVDGREIGVFASLKAAADAVSARHDRGSRLEFLDGGVS